VTKSLSEDDYQTTKTQQERHTFISSEAVFAIQEWMQVRDKYLETALKRSVTVGKKYLDDHRIIPVTRSTIQSSYITGLKKAGLYAVDKKTKRSTITSHTLRKFFISQLETKMTAEIVEKLAENAGYLGGV
jgi:integrase